MSESNGVEGGRESKREGKTERDRERDRVTQIEQDGKTELKHPYQGV